MYILCENTSLLDVFVLSSISLITFSVLSKSMAMWMGFCLTHGLCVCPTIFFFGNIVYNLSNFVFHTELNARLPIFTGFEPKEIF